MQWQCIPVKRTIDTKGMQNTRKKSGVKKVKSKGTRRGTERRRQCTDIKRFEVVGRDTAIETFMAESVPWTLNALRNRECGKERSGVISFTFREDKTVNAVFRKASKNV